MEPVSSGNVPKMKETKVQHLVRMDSKVGNTSPAEKWHHLLSVVDERLGEKIEHTAETVEVYSRTAASLLDQGTDITTEFISHSGTTIKNTVPVIHHVKLPEPMVTGIKYTAGVTNQGVELINKEKLALAGSFAKTVSSTMIETTKLPQDNQEEVPLPDEVVEIAEELAKDCAEEEKHQLRTLIATKKLVRSGSKAIDEVLASIEEGIGSVKGKAEEEVLEIVKEKLGEDVSEVLKNTFKLGSSILALKGNLSPRGVSKALMKQIAKQAIKELHQEPDSTKE